MCKEVIEHNKDAMTQLKEEKYAECHQSLLTANQQMKLLEISEPFNKTERFNIAASITFNNMGCYFKKLQQYQHAIGYLNKSLKYGQRIANDEINISSTHLNLCAVHS